VTAIDLSAEIGLAALGLLTLNLLFGLLLSVNYDPLRGWPHRRIDVLQLHNWTGYIAAAVALAHPLPLLATSRMRFSWAQLAWPIHAPSQPVENLLGTAALYLVVLVVITSYYRVEMGKRSWKAIHYLSYAAAALFFVHSLLLDPELMNRPVDWLDGEKVFVEVCFVLVLAASLARWFHGQRNAKRLRITPAVRRPAPVTRSRD
jgi:predicted ferric reductase